ncbi:MAG: DUF1572 family protein [Bacteroidia bacterium]
MKTVEAAPAKEFLRVIIDNFTRYKMLGDKTFAQLDADAFHFQFNEESNSIATLIQHVSGNLVSRFTDFLTSDGEKENRNRDKEFETHDYSAEELLEIWEKGFEVLMASLYDLTETDMTRIVFIRSEPHTVIEALLRSIAHISYHVGQIVQLGKCVKNKAWETLSIAKGESEIFNQKMKEMQDIEEGENLEELESENEASSQL